MTVSPDEVDWSVIPYAKCGVTGGLRLEWRTIPVAKPTGAFSLAGTQEKVSAYERQWPWLICGACGRESEGKLDTAPPYGSR